MREKRRKRERRKKKNGIERRERERVMEEKHEDESESWFVLKRRLLFIKIQNYFWWGHVKLPYFLLHLISHPHHFFSFLSSISLIPIISLPSFIIFFTYPLISSSLPRKNLSCQHFRFNQSVMNPSSDSLSFKKSNFSRNTFFNRLSSSSFLILIISFSLILYTSPSFLHILCVYWYHDHDKNLI